MGLDKSTNGQDHQNFISHKNHSRLMQTISKTSMAYFQLNNFFAHNNKSKIQSSLMQKYVVHGHKSSTFSLLSSSPRALLASMNNLNVNGIARLPWQPWQNMWCCSLLETLRNEYDVWIPIYAKQRRFTIEKNGSSSSNAASAVNLTIFQAFPSSKRRSQIFGLIVWHSLLQMQLLKLL